nr:hypothetical protein [uncultured Dysosmobacter sp.]
MQKIKNGLYRFMYGRNGMDQLNGALLRIYLGLFVVQVLCSLLRLGAGVLLLDALLWVLLVVICFRMFSKNLAKRRAENQKWVDWLWSGRSRRAGAKARRADKEHRYFTCKACKTICRVPVGKGRIVITCPKCGAQIDAKT